jgi:23S rRNA (cytosine1962-C5)-methyltransferase
MNLILDNLKGYSLIDSGEGEKLEDFFGVITRRPDPQAIWSRKKRVEDWENYDLYFKKTTKGFKWFFKKDVKEWQGLVLGLNLILKINNFKHTGLFPEQTLLWQMAGQVLQKHRKENPNRQIKVLNLFGYTGGVSLYLASLGADVTHIDASKQAILWANQNKSKNNLTGSVRFLLDDALKFTEKELRRGSFYDAIILDPPPYGKTSSGKKWILEDDVLNLLKNCKKILSQNKAFVLMSGYGTDYSFATYTNLLKEVFEGGEVSDGELLIKEMETERKLSCGIFSMISF